METLEPSRLEAQMAFLLAADELKGVERASRIADGSRRENSAEHSWHVALMALVLAEHCPEKIDLGRVLSLLVVHDLVEVYAGDAGIYDDAATQGQADREAESARRLFGLLPDDQEARFHDLWREFEEGTTAEARFARAVDALAPTWLHWGDHANPVPEPLTARRIMARKRPALETYPALFDLLGRVVDSAVCRKLVAP